MVTIKPKMVVTMKMHGACTTHARTDVSVRDIEVTIDEPAERGGSNLGPSPTEALMASLAGCTNRITHKIADAIGVDIKDMSVDVEATFDRRGVELKEEIDVPFPEILLTIDMVTNADDTLVERLKTDLARFCPISKVIRQSGTKITEVWNVSRA